MKSKAATPSISVGDVTKLATPDIFEPIQKSVASTPGELKEIKPEEPAVSRMYPLYFVTFK